MIHDLQINFKKKRVEWVNSYLYNHLLTLQNNSIQRWLFFVELQIMTMCDSAPGLGKVGCLPFWANPWEYFYPFGLPLPTCSDSIRKSLLGWKWSKLTRVNAQKCEEQVLLDVKLEKDHLSCAWSHLRKRWNLCFETFLLQTRATSVEPWGLVPCQGWLCLCCWPGTATGSHCCNSAK